MSTNTNFGPTPPQIEMLRKLGVSDEAMPRVRHEASKMISDLLTQKNSVAPTDKQIGRAAALNGRDLPGANRREKSTQIAFLELLAAFDDAIEQDAINEVAAQIVDLVREKFQDPKRVLLAATRATQVEEQAPQEPAPM